MEENEFLDSLKGILKALKRIIPSNIRNRFVQKQNKKLTKKINKTLKKEELIKTNMELRKRNQELKKEFEKQKKELKKLKEKSLSDKLPRRKEVSKEDPLKKMKKEMDQMKKEILEELREKPVVNKESIDLVKDNTMKEKSKDDIKEGVINFQEAKINLEEKKFDFTGTEKDLTFFRENQVSISQLSNIIKDKNLFNKVMDNIFKMRLDGTLEMINDPSKDHNKNVFKITEKGKNKLLEQPDIMEKVDTVKDERKKALKEQKELKKMLDNLKKENRENKKEKAKTVGR